MALVDHQGKPFNVWRELTEPRQQEMFNANQLSFADYIEMKYEDCNIQSRINILNYELDKGYISQEEYEERMSEIEA